jgi:Glycosyltransferase family 87
MALTAKLKLPLVLVLIILGIVNTGKLVQSVALPDAYRKDFLQEYLLARAVLMGLPAYAPLPTLAQQIVGPLPNPVFPHPTPHPPPVLILALPFGVLGYQAATVLWLIMELVCLYVTCSLIMHRFFQVSDRWAPALLALGLFSCFPVSLDLALGQLMLPTLLMLTAAWLALRSNRHFLGGGFLGLSLALKFIGWPLILFLIWRKQWRTVFSCCVVFLIANVAGAALVGFNQAVYCYRSVGPLVSKLYRSEFLNFSTWALGYRLFAGTRSTMLQGIETQPLANWPAVAPSMSLVVTVAVLGLSLLLAHTASDLDSAVAVLICASAIVNPVAWHHYLVLLVIPAAVTVKALAQNSFPPRLTFAAILIGIALLLPYLDRLGSLTTVGNPPMVPGSIGLLAFVPLVATLGLMVLTWSTSRLGKVSALGKDSRARVNP